jgi:restriction system protein
MTLWVCKGGKRGERESRFIENNVIAIGFGLLNDLSEIKSKAELWFQYEKVWPDASEGRKRNHVGQIYAFLRNVKIGDFVVVPMKMSGTIWIGEIQSEYKYRTDLGSDMQHTRNVKWVKKNIARDQFDQDLLFTFGSAMTFSKAERHEAEKRIINFAKGAKEPPKEKEEEEEAPIDLAQMAMDQLRDYISRKFRGHELAKLVAGILEAQGFKTITSPPGPDGAVDITASSGALGLSEPTMCVQVKSQDSPIDVSVYRELRDKTTRMDATHGLLVSWGGFKKTIHVEAKNDVFKIKLWESKEVIEELLRNYTNLPVEIKALIPLKQIWVLTELEEEE